jgi:glycosyltransferase involved in cell wall biosynthesis
MSNAEIISGRDIVMVGQQPWDVSIGSNCKNIALEFSKHNRVLYVNAPLDRITLLRNKHDETIKKRINVIDGKEEALVQVQDNLWNLYPNILIESINWIKSQSIFEFFNKKNNKKFATSIRSAITVLDFKDIILFNDNDIFRCFYLKELLKPSISIYYSRDFMLAVDYWKKHGTKLEPELITKNDVCVANSVYLANYCKKYNNNSFYVGQGCDLQLFENTDTATIPDDMKEIRKPVIGYVGALQHIRLDMHIIDHIATLKPHWNIVLVGPEDNEFKKSELHQHENIYFLGSKSQDELPAYIQFFDVCINPQIVNEVTVGNYPRKIDEYLAVGRPVVATKTEAMSIFSEQVYLAETKEEYLTLIEKALEEHEETLAIARKKLAMSHTWENSVKEIYKAINSITK